MGSASGQDGYFRRVEERGWTKKADHKNGQLCIISFGRNLRQLCKLLLDELQSHIQSVY